MKTKQFEANDLEVVAGSREIIACISDDTVDRDGEVLIPSGLVKKQYAGNPVVLYGHDSTQPPIGSCRWIKATGNKLIAKYYLSKTPFANDILTLMQEGVLRAHSIGFLDLEATPPTSEEIAARPDWKDCRRVVRSWELLEFSVVPIPCNPDCLAIAVAKCSPETRALLGKAWEAIPDEEICCQWDEEVDAATAKKPEETTQDAPSCCNTMKEVAPPQPTYCRSWKSIEERLNNMMKDRLDVNEILARLTGKA
jgi:HK97 family phage prohead protease